MTLGEEAACFIKNRGITQEEFAANVGICVGYANAIINGKTRPSERLKYKILDLCRCGEAEMKETKYINSSPSVVRVICKKCALQTKTYAQSLDYAAKEEAAKAWNRRVIDIYAS